MFSFRENRGNICTLGAILILAALLIFASDARAHAKMLRSVPADGEVLRQAPKTIELVFSQTLQTGGVNSISVTGENGGRFDIKAVSVLENGKKIQTELEHLDSGIYTVEWKALSTDEHLIKGSFTFEVALDSSGTEGFAAQSQNDLKNDFATPQLPKQESGMNLAQTIVRWIANLAMMVLFGGFVFLLLVLKPSLRMSANLRDEERRTAFTYGKNIFIRLAWLNLVLLIVSAAAALILQTSVVNDTGLTNAIAPKNLWQTLTETSYGAPWSAGAALTILLFAVVFCLDRENRKGVLSNANSKSQLLQIGLGVSALLFLAASFAGHARAAAREYPFAIVAQCLHLIAAGIWLGGLFHLVLIFPKIVGNLDRTQRLPFLVEAIPRFSRFAVIFSMLLGLTGVYSSWMHVSDFLSLWTTRYGNVLTAKIGVFLVMLALGGLNSFVLRPRLARLTETSDFGYGISDRQRNFYRAATIEAALGAIALLLAAALAFIPLGHQH